MPIITKTTIKRVLGVFLIIFGIAAFLTPLFPFGWVAFVGLQLLGIRTLFWDKIKAWLQKRNSQNQ